MRIKRAAGGGVTDRPATIYKKKRTSVKVFVLALTVVALGILLLFSPLFRVQEITISGNEQVSTDAIRQASGIILGVNTLKIDLRRAEAQISTIAYINSVQAVRKFPGTIAITVTESEEAAYIPFIGKLVGIDQAGKILETKPKDADIQLPLILGVNLKEFRIGAAMQLENKDRQETLLLMLKQSSINELTPNIQSIDVSDLNDIKLLLRSGTTVNLGDQKELIYKLSFLKQVLAQSDVKRGGLIDLSNPDKVIYKGN